MQLKGSRTETNLMTAFAGESQARNRYTFFSSAAKKEGFEQIAQILADISDEESAHAKQFFRCLAGGEVEIRASFPAGAIGKTADNLKAAAAGEHHEWTELYPAFAKIAREEGFEHAARAFESIAVAEKHHEELDLAIARNIEAGTVFKRDAPVVWRCRKCGYVCTGTDAPAVCPACAHPQGYFEVLGENW